MPPTDDQDVQLGGRTLIEQGLTDACTGSSDTSGCVTDTGDDSTTDDSTTGGLMDSDMDGITDDVDNCILDPNPNQSDIDTDGVGDVSAIGLQHRACPFEVGRSIDTERDRVNERHVDAHAMFERSQLLEFLTLLEWRRWHADEALERPSAADRCPTRGGRRPFLRRPAR